MAGIPNIQGKAWSWNSMTDMSVCFGGVPYIPSDTYNEGHSGTSSMLFNASRSNSIYGSSSTVTPLSLSCRMLIKY